MKSAPFSEDLEMVVQSAVLVNFEEFDIPIIQAVIHEFDCIVSAFETQ